MAEIEGIFGRHFQSPNVRGQIFFQIFACFFLWWEVFRKVFFHFKRARQE